MVDLENFRLIEMFQMGSRSGHPLAMAGNFRAVAPKIMQPGKHRWKLRKVVAMGDRRLAIP
jgi:hypothetical protein